MLLVRGELFPVLQIVLQIDFLCEIVVESERERERERESVKGERLIFEISTRDIREEQRYERRKKDEEGRRED